MALTKTLRRFFYYGLYDLLYEFKFDEKNLVDNVVVANAELRPRELCFHYIKYL